MMRISLFLLTNLCVLLLFGLFLNLIHLDSHNLVSLLFFSGIFGFFGSFVSLLISKHTAMNLIDGKIIKNPRNEIEHWLLHIMKKQSETVRISLPQLVIYNSNDINAFATGPRKNCSMIAISSSLLKKMDKEEIEAVVAHEMSHISNGDMITMTLIQGVINTFVIFLSKILSKLIENSICSNSDERKRENENSFFYFFFSTILEIMFGLLATIISFWFSRKREFHADAGSAILVGKEKMIKALQKLKMNHEPTEIYEISTFCINGKRRNIFHHLFLSHPTIEKRIEALKKETFFKSR